MLSGCAHAGIVNTVNYAREISGAGRVWAIVGGFHLGRSEDDEVQRTIDEIKRLRPRLVVPTHCTGFPPAAQFAAQMPDAFVAGVVGATYLFWEMFGGLGRTKGEHMAYDEGLAQRIRDVLGDQAGLIERRMFGGIGFLVNGNMACGVNGDNLIVRVGREAYRDALKRRGAGVFDMTGRPMTGWIAVHPEGHASDADLRGWVQRGVAFALTLPPK